MNEINRSSLFDGYDDPLPGPALALAVVLGLCGGLVGLGVAIGYWVWHV